MKEWSNAKLCDVANLILGIIVFFSPWFFHFATGTETTNSLILGIIIVLLSIAALAAFAVWEEWLNLIAGLWLIVSPWALKFSGGTAMKVNVVIGIIVAVLAAIELFLMHQNSAKDHRKSLTCLDRMGSGAKRLSPLRLE